ncbi:MAG: glycoside hydrolase family 13 protein [bacterium]
MIFNSRDKFYKNPLGPVPNGTEITYRLILPKEYGASNVCLCIAKDGLKFEYHHMVIIEKHDETDVYETKFNANMGVSPYWYYFKLNTVYNNGAEQYISKQFGGEGKLWDKPLAFQQTVYDDSFKIPSWFGEGIMYNIFPDRFNRTHIPEEIKDRVVHKDWSDRPIFEPNEKGEVLNNDFFGGNLQGIIQKLDYLKSLNVSILYLNPIFKAYSNHRYDTGDYKTIDPYLGTEDDFKELCQKAKEKGIKIILDGVFSHTGYDSLYFNGKGNYDSIGAFNSKESPYYDWFTFQKWTKKEKEYTSWWGIYTLPEVNELNEKYLSYIMTDEDSVINKWLELGASGYRLDVADELPDEFIKLLNKTVKAKNPEAFVVGEVWEDASTKKSINGRRQYVYSQCLDSVMNYVFKDSIIDFMRGGTAENFRECIEVLKENYPKDFFYSLMNIVGTHDTSRILTTLVGDHIEEKSERAKAKLSSDQRERGLSLLKLTSLIQYTMPGCPCLYYGDEAGMEGYEDPLNRMTYIWGEEEKSLLNWYTGLGKLRKDHKCLVDGDIEFLYAKGDVLVYKRSLKHEQAEIYINKSSQKQEFILSGKKIVLGKYEYKINIRKYKI